MYFNIFPLIIWWSNSSRCFVSLGELRWIWTLAKEAKPQSFLPNQDTSASACNFQSEREFHLHGSATNYRLVTDETLAWVFEIWRLMTTAPIPFRNQARSQGFVGPLRPLAGCERKGIINIGERGESALSPRINSYLYLQFLSSPPPPFLSYFSYRSQIFPLILGTPPPVLPPPPSTR